MQERPAAELVTIDDPGIDVAALRAEVRAAGGLVRAAARPANAGRRIPMLMGTAEIVPHSEFDASTPVLGEASVAIKRAVRRGLRWYLWPLTARMSSHNRAVAEVVEAHRRELARLRVDLERLDHDVAMLSPRE